MLGHARNACNAPQCEHRSNARIAPHRPTSPTSPRIAPHCASMVFAAGTHKRCPYDCCRAMYDDVRHVPPCPAMPGHARYRPVSPRIASQCPQCPQCPYCPAMRALQQCPHCPHRPALLCHARIAAHRPTSPHIAHQWSSLRATTRVAPTIVAGRCRAMCAISVLPYDARIAPQGPLLAPRPRGGNRAAPCAIQRNIHVMVSAAEPSHRWNNATSCDSSRSFPRCARSGCHGGDAGAAMLSAFVCYGCMARHPAKWHGSIRAFMALFVDSFAAYIRLDIVQQREAGTLAACEGIRLVR